MDAQALAGIVIAAAAAADDDDAAADDDDADGGWSLAGERRGRVGSPPPGSPRHRDRVGWRRVGARGRERAVVGAGAAWPGTPGHRSAVS